MALAASGAAVNSRQGQMLGLARPIQANPLALGVSHRNRAPLWLVGSRRRLSAPQPNLRGLVGGQQLKLIAELCKQLQ